MLKRPVVIKKSGSRINKPVKIKSSNFSKAVSGVSNLSQITKNKVEKVGRESVEKILVENFVSLQKVMVNLSVKLDNLAGQISQLLNLFEISAKSLAERGGDLGSGYEKRMMEKLDNLVDQNKTIARGVALLHEGEAEPNSFVTPQKFKSPPQSAPQQSYESEGSVEGYQKSISSKNQQFNKLPRG